MNAACMAQLGITEASISGRAQIDFEARVVSSKMAWRLRSKS